MNAPVTTPEALPATPVATAKPPAIVLGAGTTALSMARSLRQYGVRVIAMDSDRSALASHSRVFEFVEVEDFYSENVVEYLERFAQQFSTKPVLLASGDEHVEILSRHRDRLAQSFAVNVPEPRIVDVLLNKELFGTHAAARGWPIPLTIHCETREQARDAAARLTYPAVLKPRIKNRATRTHSPQKAFLCGTPDELLAAYSTLSQWEPEAIIQEWIPGGDDCIEFSLHYFDAGGRDLLSFEGRKIRQYLPECGSTSCAVPLAADDVRTLATEILRESGATGFCSVEFKRDPRDGALRIIEPTIGRPNLQVGLAAANGIDIVYAGYCDMAGLPVPAMQRSGRAVRWLLLPQDIRSAVYYMRRGTLNWSAYLKSLRPPLYVLPWSLADFPLMAVAAKRFGSSVRRRLS